MPLTLPDRLFQRHLGRLESPAPVMAKADLQTLEPTDWRVKVGAIVTRTCQLAGLSQKEFSASVNRDAGQVGRWTTGVERLQLDAILAVPGLRHAFLLAIAEVLEHDIDIETTITLRRRA